MLLIRCTLHFFSNFKFRYMPFFLNITAGSRKVNLTHSAHGAFGYAELISDSSVRLTQLYYDGAGSQ